MTTYGVTATGFVKKPLLAIVAELESRMKDAFGTDINVDAKSVFGKLIGCFAQPMADVWEMAEAVYNAAYPNSSFGAAFDGCLEMIGLRREEAVKSDTTVICKCAIGTTIGTSVVVATVGNGDRFSPSAEVQATQDNACEARIVLSEAEPITDTFTVTINGHDYTYAAVAKTQAQVIAAIRDLILAGVDPVTAAVGDIDAELYLVTDAISDAIIGLATEAEVKASTFTVAVAGDNFTLTSVSALVNFEAEAAGQVIAYVNKLTDIVVGAPGLVSARNIFEAANGQVEEADAQGRLRRAQSLARPGSTTPDAIRARLLEVDGVTQASVMQNVTDVTDGDGLLPHSIKAIVVGGDTDDIAAVLWENCGGGIYMNGAVSTTVVDSEGFSQTVRFSRPSEVLMWVRATYAVNTDDGETFPPDGPSLIGTAALTFGQALRPGQDVLPQRFPGAIFDAVPGIRTLLIEVAEDNGAGAPGAYQATPWTIARDEWAVFAATRVTVTT